MFALLLKAAFLASAVLAAPTPAPGQIWAVLIAGSNGYGNYRHQSDVCHAYQILHRHGVPDSNIVVIMYDDIADNANNPHKGVIINRPNGSNVYPGVPKDYVGESVTPETFYNVLTGKHRDVAHKGSGKVLNSGPNDHVFIYFTDHGAPGLIGFPNDIMYADDLLKALKKMHRKKMFKRLVFYLESCESGSMFDKILPENINIFATTAANPRESSYAIYWDSGVGAWLGDAYSVAWMEDVDSRDDYNIKDSESLVTQYANVVNRVAQCKDISHPQMYGELDLDMDVVGNYIGNNSGSSTKYKAQLQPFTETVSSRDVMLKTLEKKLQMAEIENDSKGMTGLRKEINILLKGRQLIDELFDATLGRLNAGPKVTDHSHNPISLEMMPCYKSVVNHLTRNCVNISKNTYALTHLYKLANLCAENTSASDIVEALTEECTEELKRLQDIN